MVGQSSRGERKLVTVLFADLVGSTASASDEDPERVRARLDRFYDAMTAEIEAAGGTVEKFAGDAVMAAFGAPAALEDHAERALHAALAMQRRLRELDGALLLRIGVNTGEVVVGRPREGSSFVTGDAVNVAARLEQAAEAGEILAGERTVAAVRGAFEFGDPTSVEAKGKPGGVPCRRLLRALSLMRPRGVGGLRQAFVGRERELELLTSAYRSAVERRRPQLVTIVGDPGVGKTRLVRELWQWLAEQRPQPLQRTGRCLSYGQVTYWALGEVLREELGLLDSDPPEAALERLGDRRILALALGLDVAAGVHPLVARDRFQDAWVELLGDLSGSRPMALLVEDVHWAEEPLLDLLEHLLAAVEGPVLLIATARPELLDRRPGWGARAGGTIVGLEPLEPAAANKLLAELLGAEPPAELSEVVAQAEGNPFFVEEIVGSLVDQGVLGQRNGGWALRELPAGFAMPDTVQAVVAARIDLLEPAEKAALQAASVIGRVFWSGPVYELLPGLEPDLHVLEERDFVRLRLGSSIEGEREYAIKHAVTREVAYTSITKGERARLHAAFAEWVERLGGGRDDQAALLAHHYAEAVRPEDVDLAWAGQEARLEELRASALRWLRRAAELAVGRYEIDEALSLFERALELETEDRARSELLRRIGRANALKFDGEAFWSAMERSLALSTDREASAEAYAELAYQTASRSAMWKRAPQTDLVRGWIDQALELGEPTSSARAKALIASVLWDSPRPELAREASALAETLGDTELRVNAWVAVGIAAHAQLEYEEALRWLERPFSVSEQVDDPELAAEIYWNPMPCTLTLGRFADARQLGQHYFEASQRLTPHHRVHGIAAKVEIEELMGSWDSILGLQDEVEETIGENLATPCARNPRSLLVCALANACVGHESEAARLEAQAESVWMEGYPALLGPPRIRLAVLRGDPGALEELLGEGIVRHMYWFGLAARTARLDALAALRDQPRVEAEAAPLVVEGTYPEPFALRALGIVREDEALIEQAHARFAAFGLDWHAAQTDALVQIGRSL